MKKIFISCTLLYMFACYFNKQFDQRNLIYRTTIFICVRLESCINVKIDNLKHIFKT